MSVKMQTNPPAVPLTYQSLKEPFIDGDFLAMLRAARAYEFKGYILTLCASTFTTCMGCFSPQKMRDVLRNMYI